MTDFPVPLHGDERNLLSSHAVSHLASGDRSRPEFYATPYSGIENEAKSDDCSTSCHEGKFPMFLGELPRLPSSHQQ